MSDVLVIARLALQEAVRRRVLTVVAIISGPVMGFIAGNWSAGLGRAVKDGSAVGHRGHNVKLPETVRVPYGPLPNLSRALRPALSNPTSPTIAPVLVKGAPVAVIAVGDPFGEIDGAALARLAELLARAYERLS